MQFSEQLECQMHDKYIQFKLLHLSDIHYKGEKESSRRMFNGISELGKSKDIDAVIICGDLMSRGNYKAKFKKDLNAMLSKFAKSLSLENSKFIFVPGNHDVNGDKKNLNLKFSDFISFVNRFRRSMNYDEKLHWMENEFEANQHDKGIATDGIYSFRKDGFNIDFILLNSVRFYAKEPPKESPKKSPKKNIRIDKKILDGIDCRKLRERPSLKIAVTHNPPIALWSASNNKYKSISNSEQLLEVLSSAGVGMILHGDSHKSQHIAVAKSLNETDWPLYAIGSGLISPNTPGFVHFHMINIMIKKDSAEHINNMGAEVEITSFKFEGNNIITEPKRSYVLNLPIYETTKKYTGTAQIFDLPIDRTRCQNHLVKKMLYEYKSKAIDLIYDSTVKLLSPNNKRISVTPDHMFSFFYDSMFHSFNPNKNMFRAIHHGKYMDLVNSPSSDEILTEHRKMNAKKEGCVERIVILTENETSDTDNFRTNFKLFLNKINQYMFNTYVTSEKLIDDFIKNNTFNGRQEPNLANMDSYNIALFSESGNGNENMIAYYLEKAMAYVSIDEKDINAVSKCIESLWRYATPERLNDDTPSIWKCSELDDTNLRSFFDRI